MSVNWECKYCCKLLESDNEYNIEGSILEIIEHLQDKIDNLSEQCECRKEFKKEQTNDEKCPKCKHKLDWTYEIKESYKQGEDPRMYGVICINCGYEKYN